MSALIAALPGTGKLALSDAQAVAAARVAFAALTAGQRALVDEAALVAAEARLAELQAAEKAAADKAAKAVKAGDELKVAGSTFRVLNAKSRTVALVKAKNAKSFAVPATVKLRDGKTYKVTQVGAKAFTGAKIRTVTLGANVSKLAAGAFTGSKATTIVVKGTALAKKSAVKGSLKGSKVKTLKVKVGSAKANKKAVKQYKKAFTRANTAANSKITVS